MIKAIHLFKFSSFLLLLIFLSSCNKAPIYKAVAEDKMKKEIQYIGFDNQSAIRYAISNDQEFLYIRLEALSKPAVLKIIQSGFYIYFDTIGKKDKNMWLNFPIGKSDGLFQAKLFKEVDKENAAITGKIELESQLKEVGKLAAFGANETEEMVENDLDKGFAFRLESGEYGSLSYYAAIRLDKIKKGGYHSIDKLNIGIISGAFKKPNLGGSAGGGGGGGRGGGNYGGMSRVPQPQNQSNMDPERMRDMYLMSQPITFWVNVQIYKP
ncbi:MAG TPA: hypothetical protein DCG69_08965 [Bacteroidales bacterium]|nr:hypothetical protein [Bacteroidales bacterium]